MAPSKYITLVSAEGYEYVLPREACHASQMLRTSVDPDKHFKENRETVVNLPEMRLVFPPVLSLTLTCRVPSAHLLPQIVLRTSVDDETHNYLAVFFLTEPPTNGSG
jgi:hypothetical protein